MCLEIAKSAWASVLGCQILSNWRVFQLGGDLRGARCRPLRAWSRLEDGLIVTTSAAVLFSTLPELLGPTSAERACG